MNGVKIPILRDEAQEYVFLSLRRHGPQGKKITTAKRKLRKLQNLEGRYYKKIVLVSEKLDVIVAGKAGDADAKMEKLSKEQDAYCEASIKTHNEIADLALEIVSTSLMINYKNQKEVDAILDCLSDQRLLGCVDIIELGDVPKDFFPCPDTQQKEIDTSSSEGTPTKSSSKKDIKKKTSKKGA